MKYKDFKKLLDTYKTANEVISDACDVGIDLMEGKYETQSYLTKLFELCIKTHYTEDGLEWVDWFVYENDYGKKGMKAFDADDNLICQNKKQLWEYLEKHADKFRESLENN